MKSKKLISRIGILMAISFLNGACSVFGIRSEETPKYEVLEKNENMEIRSYAGYVVAKTVVKGDFKDSQNEGFRILAGYIFGANEKKQKLSMTAPVVQEKTSENEKISMTAPVLQIPQAGGWVMTFMMPSKYKLADLPTPNDKRVLLEEMPPKVFGVIRYSGLWRQEKVLEKSVELKEWVITKPYDVIGEPIFAGYDPPWTLPFFRRNETLLELKSK